MSNERKAIAILVSVAVVGLLVIAIATPTILRNSKISSLQGTYRVISHAECVLDTATFTKDMLSVRGINSNSVGGMYLPMPEESEYTPTERIGTLVRWNLDSDPIEVKIEDEEFNYWTGTYAVTRGKTEWGAHTLTFANDDRVVRFEEADFFARLRLCMTCGYVAAGCGEQGVRSVSNPFDAAPHGLDGSRYNSRPAPRKR